VDAWIENDEPGADQIATLRRAFADSQALVYMGFAEAAGAPALAEGLDELEARHDEAALQLVELTERRESIGRTDAPPARLADDGEPEQTLSIPDVESLELGDLSRQIADAKRMVETLERQVEARKRALPLYRATLDTESLADALRTRRDHPMHALLRRMYHEQRAGFEERGENR
jgi:hypothetical protein